MQLKRLIFYSTLLCLAFGFVNLAKAQNDELHRLLETADRFEQLAKIDSAVLFCDSAILLSKQQNNVLFHAYALSTKGRFLSNDIERSLPLLFEAHDLAIINNFDTIQARTEINLGIVLGDIGKTDTALYLLNNAVKLYENVKDSAGMAKTYSNLANLYMDIAAYESALEYHLKSYFLYKKLDNWRIIYPLVNMGNLYEKLKEYDTALSCYKIAYEGSIAINKPILANKCLLNQAVIYYRFKEYEKSLNNFKQVITYSESINDKPELITLYSNISLVYRKFGQNEKSMEMVKKSLQMAQETGNVPKQMKALNNLAIYYKRDEKYALAENYYKQSLTLAEQTGYKLDKAKALVNLSNLYSVLGNYETALDYHRRYYNVQDSILNEAKVRAIAELPAKYELIEVEAKILQLENENAQQEIEKRDILLERNAIFGSSVTLVLLLLMGFWFYRSKLKKDRIIAEQKLRQMEDERKLLSAQALMEGEEKERKRIAQELHDGIGVLLSTASIHFSGVEAESEDEKTSELVKRASKLLKQAGGEVRKISQNMMPGILSKFGLQEALTGIFEDLNDSGKIEVEFNIELNDERLPENTEIMLYRIIQELVNNTLKHAEATKINFSLRISDNKILIDYSDNGKGFDLKNVENKKSLGLSGIQSRVDFLKGDFNLDSKLGSGTFYQITVPHT